jgi:hypothetical protein
MRYRGIDYIILKNKTLVMQSCFDQKPVDAEWYCHVNTTNGIDETDPTTQAPRMKVVGFNDIWKKDHYGNKYAVKELLYEPDNGFGLNIWEKIEA